MMIGITGGSNTANTKSWAYALQAAASEHHTVHIRARVGFGPWRQRGLLAKLPAPLDMLIVSPSGNGMHDGVALYMRRLDAYMLKARKRAPRIYCLTISPRLVPAKNDIARELSRKISETYPSVIDIFHPMSDDLNHNVGTDPENHWRPAGQRCVLRLVREATKL